ncbi:RNA chaperone Hfq [Bacillus cereus]|uniref:RNA chaperone Hfq n=2 Tax=Bacillus cereus group TaxID=86661 RepID=UPI0007ABC06F|nr:RNA chaperone Hfq [Bacillus cereus]KZD47314.1 RNA-binding protein Hfq [Bacillus cereus]
MEHLQEELYKQIKEEKGTVTIFLKSGVRIVGEVVGVDKFTVLILVDGKQQLIYKQAISSLLLACLNINAGSN